MKFSINPKIFNKWPGVEIDILVTRDTNDLKNNSIR